MHIPSSPSVEGDMKFPTETEVLNALPAYLEWLREFGLAGSSICQYKTSLLRLLPSLSPKMKVYGSARSAWSGKRGFLTWWMRPPEDRARMITTAPLLLRALAARYRERQAGVAYSAVDEYLTAMDDILLDKGKNETRGDA